MLRHYLLIFTLALSSSLLVGCVSEGARTPKRPNGSEVENQAKFVLLDSEMQKAISCSGLQERRTTEGLLEVVAHVRNRLPRSIRVEINCDFKDQQGFSTSQMIPYKVVRLAENEQRDMQFISTSTLATTYTIHVRKER